MTYDVPERPLDPPEYEMPICPVCGSECEKIYILGSAVVGCDECIEEKSAYDRQEDEQEQYLEREMYRELDRRLGK